MATWASRLDPAYRPQGVRKRMCKASNSEFSGFGAARSSDNSRSISETSKVKQKDPTQKKRKKKFLKSWLHNRLSTPSSHSIDPLQEVLQITKSMLQENDKKSMDCRKARKVWRKETNDTKRHKRCEFHSFRFHVFHFHMRSSERWEGCEASDLKQGQKVLTCLRPQGHVAQIQINSCSA